MPKKQPKNGFFYFMLNYKQRAERRGRTFPGGLSEVAAAASPEWKTLPQFRKDYFNDIAKERKNDPRPNIMKRDEKRFNSAGVSFAELKMKKAKEEERRRQECDFISKFVHQMNLNDLRDKLMYLIHVNIFCKTDRNQFYPAEIGIVKFNLRKGVQGVFHRYIDPGEIAPGYSFEIKDHVERTHKLTIQFVRSVEGTSDFSRLYSEICDFLKSGNEAIPPLFTMYDDVFNNTSLEAVKGMFKSLWAHVHPSHDQDDNSWESVFKVLPLPDMFFHLKNRCMAVINPNTIAFPNDVLAKAQLQKDTYHYELDTACKFHRDEDIIAHCSKSFVLRWVYIIRDNCADLIGVDLFPKCVAPKIEIKEEKDHHDDTMSTTDSQYSDSYSEASTDSKWSTCTKLEASDYTNRGRDFSNSPVRVCKRELDSHCSPERVAKREKNDDEFSIIRPVKQEKTEESFLVPSVPIRNVEAHVVKSEKDNVLFAGSFMREKACEEVAVDSIKKERKVEAFISTPVKREKETSWYSVTEPIKREKDGASPIKQEKNVDFIKEERDSISVKPEKCVDLIKTENKTNVVKEEKNIITLKEDVKEEKKFDANLATGCQKVEKIDLSYADW